METDIVRFHSIIFTKYQPALCHVPGVGIIKVRSGQLLHQYCVFSVIGWKKPNIILFQVN